MRISSVGIREVTIDPDSLLSSRFSGFTLLEVMVAIAILGGVILTVITSFNYHQSVVSRDWDETCAVIFGRAKIDDPGFHPLGGEMGTFAPDRPDMSWKTEILTTDYPGVNRLVFTVSWDAERRKIDFVQYSAK